MSAPVVLVSRRKFADLDGCTEKVVRDAVNDGILPLSVDGKIDAALAGTGWRKGNRHPGTRAYSGKKSAPQVRKTGSQKVRTPNRPTTVDELGDALDDIGDEALTDFLTNLLDGKFADTAQAERIKENGLAAKHLIAARKEAGNLVEVDRAEAVLFEAARQARDAWQGFPTRIGPLLAADLGVDADRVVEALTVHVQQQLEQLGRPKGDFAPQQ